MQPRFEQFTRERQYLTNVSPRTIEWYEQSLKWLRTETPTESDLKDVVLRRDSEESSGQRVPPPDNDS